MKRLEAAQKELEDSFIVMTHLETKMSNVLKEQAEYVASHEDRLRTHGSRLHDHEAIWRRIETGLAEATDKINFLIDREMRREGGLESR